VSLTKVDAGSLGNYSVTMRYVPPLVVLQSADPISAASADASFSATKYRSKIKLTKDGG